MTFQYSLNEDDYLAYQLYIVSKSKRSIKNRKKVWLIMVSMMVFICWSAYCTGHLNHLYVLIPLTLIVLIFYPVYQKWYYRRHYINHIKEHYKNKVDHISTLELNSECIKSTSKVGEASINLKEVMELNETRDYLFVKISTGESLILPKVKVDTNLFKQELLSFLPSNDLIVTEELNWKWY